MVRRLAFPAPPPPWYGLVGVGGWRVRKWVGAVGAATGWWGGAGGRPGLTRKPYSYNVARAPVLINLNLYVKPYTQP